MQNESKKNDKRSSVRPAKGPRYGLRWSHVSLVASGMILMAAIRIVVDYRGQPAVYGPPAMGLTTTSSAWGVLTEQSLMLDRPDAALQRPAATEIRWVFRGYDTAALEEFFKSCGLSARKLGFLLDRQNWQVAGDSITVTPPLAVIQEMNPAARRKVYDVLAREPENMPQRYPFVFRGSFEEWFADCQLPPQQLRELRRMVYKKDNVFVFSDISYFQLTTSSNEVFQLVRQISRVPTVMASLSLKRSSDVTQLQHYWQSPDGTSRWDGVVASLARQHPEELDVAALLPSLPRALLYRYPDQRLAVPRNADCVWTAMNFFNDPPDDRFVDQAYTGEILNTAYRVVPQADAFGDVIMLYKPAADGRAQLIHMCVQIAGDVVFTKNGGDIFQPWVLMRMEDVRVLFSYEPEIRTTVFRRRGRGS